LLNSINILNHTPPTHVDHPGTTVQLVGATVIKSVQKVKIENDTNSLSVLKYPEMYLKYINVVIVLTLSLLLYLFGLVILDITKDVKLAILAQLTPFYSITIFENIFRVNPDPFLLISTILLCIWISIWLKNSDEHLLIISLIFGFGIVTKITFAFMLIIPLMIIRKWSNKRIFLFSVGGVFILLTLPILDKYGYISKWAMAIFYHSGYYGLGPKGILDETTFLINLKRIILGEPLLSFLLLFSTGLIVLLKTISRKKIFSKKWAISKVILAVTLSLLIQIFFVAKHYQTHYLVSSLSLLGFLLVMQLQLVKTVIKKSPIIISIILSISLILCFTNISKYFEKIRANTSKLKISLHECQGKGLLFGSNFNGYFLEEKLQYLYPKTFINENKNKK
jgi:hypothetical protein